MTLQLYYLCMHVHVEARKRRFCKLQTAWLYYLIDTICNVLLWMAQHVKQQLTSIVKSTAAVELCGLSILTAAIWETRLSYTVK